MILEELTIRKNKAWEANPNGYTGMVRFKNAQGAVELALNHETSRRILAVVADTVVESSREIAANLTRDSIDSIPALMSEQQN
jgi:hypothetical protein